MIPTIWLIAKRSLSDALFYVYLPVLFFFPMYYVFSIPHVSEIRAVDVILLPILVVAVAKYGQYWRWQRADLWLLLFILGVGISEAATVTIGMHFALDTMQAAVLPYVTGKLVIEGEGIRDRIVRRMAWLASIVAVISLVEFRLGKNPFTAVYYPIFQAGSPSIEQIRGFTRVQGPYGHAIYAGMVFGTVLILTVWLRYRDRLILQNTERRFFGLRISTILVGGVALGLLITYSRGPWAATFFGLLITRIGPARNVRKATLIVVLLAAILGAVGYSYIKGYTSGSWDSADNIDQQNAIYRRMLVEYYGPIADAGGMFGWGVHFPRIPGEPSIDNEFLFLRLRQGWFGMWTFILLAAEGALALLRKARHASDKIDFYFALALLGVLVAEILNLTSTTLNTQAEQLFYLCLGWGLATWSTRVSAFPAVAPVAISRPKIYA